MQECYCVIPFGQYVLCLVLLQFLNLPQLKILHLTTDDPTIPTVDNTYYTGKCTELEKCIEMNSTLQEINIGYHGEKEITSIITSVIRGVTRNRTITSLTIQAHYALPLDIPEGVIEQLLKDNKTLQALLLDIRELLQSSLNIVEVNTPLTALELGGWSSSEVISSSLLPHIKRLHCLKLHDPYPPHLLFLCQPNLHTLTLQIGTAEDAIELFTILQTNTTLKALSMKIEEEMVCVYTTGDGLRNNNWSNPSSPFVDLLSSIDTSLRDMLIQNKTLKYLEINLDEIDLYKYIPISSSFLSFLTTGLRHNTSLQQLGIFIPLNEETITFINVISQKNNLTELQIYFKPDQSYSNCSWEERGQIMTPLFYEQLVPAVTNMLQSHTTIRLLKIWCRLINKSSQPNWIKLVQHLYEAIYIHPSLEYTCLVIDPPPLLVDTLKDQKKTLIDRHRKEQPHKPLPIVEIKYIN